MKYLVILLVFGALAYIVLTYKTKPNFTVPEEYQGLWDRIGYGDVVAITDQSATVYQYTRQTCVQGSTFNKTRLSELISSAQLSEDGQTIISMEENRPLLTSHLKKVNAFPIACQPNKLIENSPTMTFDHLWHTFNDYYAFFDERGIDWDKSYLETHQTVTDDSSDEDLLIAINSLLTPLNDGHVTLNTGENEFSYSDFEERAAFKYFTSSYANQTEFNNPESFQANLNEQFFETVFSYFDSDIRGNAGGSAGTSVYWAASVNNVGYLYVSDMIGLTANDSNSADENVEAINGILKRALTDLNRTDALIIDMRFNQGGLDEVSLAIANHFTDQPTLAFSKFTRSFNVDTDPIEAFFSPVTDSLYLKPIAILTSEITASAAEVFLIIMTGLSHVTIVGENTPGILSDSLYRVLPNNWTVAVPNVVFMDSNGATYEVTGVPPDTQAHTILPEIIESKKDIVIETAFTALGY